MNSRKRILWTLGHREPDRVPCDLGSTNVTTLTVDAYRVLRQYLKINQENPIEVVERAQQLVKPEEAILKCFKINTRSAWLRRPKNWECSLKKDNSYIDEWGITRRKASGSWYFDPVVFPLKVADISDLKKYSWPNPDDPERFKGLKKEIEKLYQGNEYPIVVDPTGSIPFGNAQALRGFDTFLIDLMLNQKFAEALMDKLLDFQTKLLKNLFKEVGNCIDIIKVADDLATQNGPLISPELYRKLIKPRHRRLISFIKENSKAKVFFHTDGGIYPFIEDLIEIGVDILNPIQVSAHGMDPRKLKKEFGNQVCFWGGIDTQKVLPYGNVKDVEEEVKRRIDELAPGGGYVLAPVHNIQPDVPPENICAMYKTAQEYGKNVGISIDR